MTCFQPTYEGLKPLDQGFRYLSYQGFPAYLRGIETFLSIPAILAATASFQPTYEGLKQPRLIIVDEADMRFQPTYEGLKHQYHVGQEPDPWVSSLPTRD